MSINYAAFPRTDRDRFSDWAYCRNVIQAQMGVFGPLSPEKSKVVDEEFRQLCEHWKILGEVVGNLLQLGIGMHITAQYLDLCGRAVSTRIGFMELMRVTLQFTKESRNGAQFIQYLVQNTGKISKSMSELKLNSVRFLGFLVAIQVFIHVNRGDYAKAAGEIVKTALSVPIPAMVLIDLIDNILGHFLPEWVLKQPVVRMVRSWNPAQCASYITENVCWLVYCATVAKTKGDSEFNQALDAWLTKLEQSPMAIYAPMGEPIARIFDSILPNSWSQYEIYGASIRNLVDYYNQNPNQSYF